MINGTVWSENDAVSKEKISAMLQDDETLRAWAEAAPQGTIDNRFATSGMWGGGSTTIFNQTIWLPLPNRMIKWQAGNFYIDFNGATTGQQIKISFWIDGTQVFEYWHDSIGPTTIAPSNAIHTEPIAFVVDGLAVGNHTFQIKGDFTPAVAGTTVDFNSRILDIGKSMASQ